MILGCHVRMKAPLFLEGSVQEAVQYHADALMVYTGAPQNTVRRPVSELHIQQAHALMAENGIASDRMIVHAPYLINLANPDADEEKTDFSLRMLKDEISRTDRIHASMIVLHPGSSVKQSAEDGVETLIRNLNRIEKIPDGVTVCLEILAGKGHEIGTDFFQLAAIRQGLKHPESYGFCLDTCHMNDGGYDLKKFDSVLDSFDEICGLRNLRLLHLNDSLNEKGSHQDRHANIGMGTIGFKTLHAIASNDRLREVPMILETPWIGNNPPYGIEISMLKKREVFFPPSECTPY